MGRVTYVDVVRPGRALITGTTGDGGDDGFGGEIIREGRDYLVEDAYGTVVGRARSYRAAAARHYDTDPGRIEITFERTADGGWSGA